MIIIDVSGDMDELLWIARLHHLVVSNSALSNDILISTRGHYYNLLGSLPTSDRQDDVLL